MDKAKEKVVDFRKLQKKRSLTNMEKKKKSGFHSTVGGGMNFWS